MTLLGGFGGEDSEVVAVGAEGGEGGRLDHEDVVNSLLGEIGAGIRVAPGYNYLLSAILRGERRRLVKSVCRVGNGWPLS